MAQVAIVGAGVAGLAAGRELARAGHAVTIYEKSRGVGGRAATRRVEGFSIDHGAQYFKAPTPALQALVDELPGAYDIREPVWVFNGTGQISEGDPAQNAEPKWTWPGGINALAKHLARELAVRQESTIASLRAADAGYELLNSNGTPLGSAEIVLLTPPAAQSAAIVAASKIDITVSQALLAALAPARYRRCLSIALAYQRRPATPWYALVNSDRKHPISWLACEHFKPNRAPAEAGLLLAQMAPGWSETHWDELAKGTYAPGELPAAVREAHTLVQALVGAELGEPLWANAQRWRYALPDAPAAELPHTQGLFLAGDFVVGQGRVHLAIENGWQAAQRIMALHT